MQKETTEVSVESSPTWEHLETWVRRKMRTWLQALFDAEVDEVAGPPQVVAAQGRG